MKINDIQDQIIEQFEQFEDWMDKYSLIIEMGSELPKMEDSDKTEQNLIVGCQSNAWLSAETQEGKLIFHADSDAIIVKGFISLLLQILSNQTPSDIIEADLYALDKIGLKANLSPTRSNGLLSMLKQIKMYALAYQAKGV